MPTPSRIESLPGDVLSDILLLFNRNDLVNLSQTCRTMRTLCHDELSKKRLSMSLTTDTLGMWARFFLEEHTPLTRGAQSLCIIIDSNLTDVASSFVGVDPNVFDPKIRPMHPDATRVLPLPSNLRHLHLTCYPHKWRSADQESFSAAVQMPPLFFFFLRTLPDRCPQLEELTIAGTPNPMCDEFDACMRRLPHLKRLNIAGNRNPERSPNLVDLPGSLTDLMIGSIRVPLRNAVAHTLPWTRTLKKIAILGSAPQGCAEFLRILAEGCAHRLVEVKLNEDREDEGSVVEVSTKQEDLTRGLKGFAQLHPPVRTLTLCGMSAWSSPLHLPLLQSAVASTLTYLSLQGVQKCIFPGNLPWPRLCTLHLREIARFGYKGDLDEPIFPSVTRFECIIVSAVEASKDFLPALQHLLVRSGSGADMVRGLVRHEMTHILLDNCTSEEECREHLEAMDGHKIGCVEFEGRFPHDLYERYQKKEGVLFPEFPNILDVQLSDD